MYQNYFLSYFLYSHFIMSSSQSWVDPMPTSGGPKKVIFLDVVVERTALGSSIPCRRYSLMLKDMRWFPLQTLKYECSQKQTPFYTVGEWFSLFHRSAHNRYYISCAISPEYAPRKTEETEQHEPCPRAWNIKVNFRDHDPAQPPVGDTVVPRRLLVVYPSIRLRTDPSSFLIPKPCRRGSHIRWSWGHLDLHSVNLTIRLEGRSFQPKPNITQDQHTSKKCRKEELIKPIHTHIVLHR